MRETSIRALLVQLDPVLLVIWHLAGDHGWHEGIRRLSYAMMRGWKVQRMSQANYGVGRGSNRAHAIVPRNHG